MITLPALVTATLSFDTWSDKLTKGESAIVYEVEEYDDGARCSFVMMSIDRPRLIRHYFASRPEQVLKRWLKPHVA